METVTVAEAAKLKGCSKSTILQLIRKKILPAERRGPIFLVLKSAVDAYQLPGAGRPRGSKNLQKKITSPSETS
jgi:excisionase family DNA binding protein